MADLGFYLFRGFRTRSTRNLALAFREDVSGEKVRKIAGKSLNNFFRAFVEIAVALEIPQTVRAEITMTGREHVAAALARGRGVIALGAHLGNFFLVGTRLKAEGFPVNVLVNQPRDGRVGLLLDSYRLKIGQKTIHAKPRRLALREMVLALRQNELVIVIADEYRDGSGIHVPFFGHTVLARRGPATLALRTGAAVVPINLIRQPDGGLRLIVEPELPISKTGRTAVDVRESTLRMTRWLERTVQAYPEQWNWMNIRWQQVSQSNVVAEERRVEGLSR